MNDRGFSLALALFIVVVLALFAAGLFRMTQVANIGVAHEVLSIRALYAAESGVNASAMTVFPIAGGVGVCESATYVFTASGLTNCSASVSCSEIIVNGESLYQITSQGRCGVDEHSASRTVDVWLRNL